MIRAFHPAWSMKMAYLYEVTVMASWTLWFWIPFFYWDWVCTVQEWSNSSLSFTYLLPLVTIAKTHIFVAQQSHWTGTTQDNIFLSLDIVLNSQHHMLVTMVFIHLKKMDMQVGTFLFVLECRTVETTHKWCYMCYKNWHPLIEWHLAMEVKCGLYRSID